MANVLTLSILFLNYLPNFEFLNSAKFHNLKKNWSELVIALVFVFHLVGRRRRSQKQSWCKNHFTKDQKRSKVQEMTLPLPPSSEKWEDDGRWWIFLKTATTALVRWRKAILKQRWAWSLDLMHAARLSAHVCANSLCTFLRHFAIIPVQKKSKIDPARPSKPGV